MIQINIKYFNNEELNQLKEILETYDLFYSISPTRLIFTEEQLVQLFNEGWEVYYLDKKLNELEGRMKELIRPKK